jgi:pyruvate kinase
MASKIHDVKVGDKVILDDGTIALVVVKHPVGECYWLKYYDMMMRLPNGALIGQTKSIDDVSEVIAHYDIAAEMKSLTSKLDHKEIGK